MHGEAVLVQLVLLVLLVLMPPMVVLPAWSSLSRLRYVSIGGEAGLDWPGDHSRLLYAGDETGLGAVRAHPRPEVGETAGWGSVGDHISPAVGDGTGLGAVGAHPRLLEVAGASGLGVVGGPAPVETRVGVVGRHIRPASGEEAGLGVMDDQNP